MSGTPLESKLPLCTRKRVQIGKVMTSLMVITFGIGQSAGEVSKSAMVKDMTLPQRPHGCRETMKV